jgi:putative chitinase
MTKQEFIKLVPSNPSLADRYYQPIKDTMDKFNIDTPLRQSHFISQLLHETGNLQYTQEIASGKAYEGRKDLGNTQVGDGARFKGRGLFQLTGRANYKAFGDYIGVDLIKNPELVANNPKIGSLVAGWFWNVKKLNKKADNDDIIGVTKSINGGLNGIADRVEKLKNAKAVITEPYYLDLGFMKIKLN